MRTSNPVLRDSTFAPAVRGSAQEDAEVRGLMTVQGTMTKTAILLGAVVVAASFTWGKCMTAIESGAGFGSVMPWFWGGFGVGIVLALIISFKPHLAPSLAVPYALAEGLFLGAISAVYAYRFSGEQAVGGLASGIVFQAVTLTFTVALAMLGLYAFRIIRVTERLRSIVMAATGGIMLFYLVSFVLGFFGIQVPLIHSGGMMGIGFSVFVVGLAAFNLLMDFDFIERGSRAGAPKHMEWYGAFGLLVTLVWLYIELLRLLAKLRSND